MNEVATTKQAYNRSEQVKEAGLATRWPTGTSGNLDGRPKNSLTTLLREILESDDGKKRQKLVEEMVALATTTGGRGQIPALMEIFNRIDGKVTDTLKLEGEIPVKLIFYREKE